ncbi:MAG: rod shape-determining protein MreD [Candidatus Omnitrophica bacterium]|nr:rod shape-determining protein MreD [Candidatus Omnitrophota bacterium]
MIKPLIVIAVLAYIFFILEFMLNGTLGVWAKPELLLLLVVFWGLYAGIRHSIWAAVVGGLLKDAFSIQPFGTYLFVFVSAAYLTTLVRRWLYQPGSRFSRAVVAFFVLIACFCIEMALYLMAHNVRLEDLFFNILLPQIVTTMVAVTFVFYWLRDIAQWLKV